MNAKIEFGRSFRPHVLVLVALLPPLLIQTGPAMAFDEPKFQKVTEFEEFEIRRYEPTLIAETTVTDDFDEAGKIAFKRLGGYIFGANARKDKIEMTAPVTTLLAGEGAGKKTWKISFVMPEKFTLESLPLPSDATVTHRKVEGQVVAVHRFTGTWSEERFAEKGKLLLEAVQKQGMTAKPETLRYARYNSPWSLWFLRRNEAMVDLDVKAVVTPPKPQVPARR
jgi:hypothetical protein